MSAPDPADTVIEQFIAEGFAFQPASEVPLQAQRLRIRLHDAGLLADPADRDGTTQWQRANIAEVRAERAEAERDELRALIVEAGLETYAPDGSERVAAHLTEQQRIITGLRAERHRVEADLAALRNRIGSIAGVLRCVDAPAASMIQDALDGGDPK